MFFFVNDPYFNGIFHNITFSTQRRDPWYVTFQKNLCFGNFKCIELRQFEYHWPIMGKWPIWVNRFYCYSMIMLPIYFGNPTDVCKVCTYDKSSIHALFGTHLILKSRLLFEMPFDKELKCMRWYIKTQISVPGGVW